MRTQPLEVDGEREATVSAPSPSLSLTSPLSSNIPSTARRTEPSAPLLPGMITHVPNPTADKVVASVQGVVVGVTSENVVVKIAQTDLVVHFPKEFFPSEEMVAYGTPLRYEIVEDARGRRFQRFSRGEANPDRQVVDEIERVLSTIKYR